MEDPAFVPLHNGRSLQPLTAVNSEHLSVFDCGVWGETVPDQLRLVLQQPQKYQQAISIINAVSRTKVRSFLLRVSFGILLFMTILLSAAGIPVALEVPVDSSGIRVLQISAITLMIAAMVLVFYKLVYFKKHESAHIVRELQKAVGQANCLLFEENILMGAESNSKLLLVYVSVDGCRRELTAQSQDHLFHRAMLKYSCAYTCCLAKRYFPFPPVSNMSHLEGSMCFCQFVISQLSTRKTWRFYWSREQPLYSTFP